MVQFQINHHVIALHPQLKSSYVPGVVENIHGNSVQVKCYDNQVISVDQLEVYRISYQKYKLDVDYIKKKENDRVHSVAIARCDEAGTYLSGNFYFPLIIVYLSFLIWVKNIIHSDCLP